MGMPIDPAAAALLRGLINGFDQGLTDTLPPRLLRCEKVLQVADRLDDDHAAVKQIMRQTQQRTILFRHNAMHRFRGIEEARPSGLDDVFRQRSGAMAVIEGVVTVPQRTPLRVIVRDRGANYHGVTAR